jgi:capsid portal protein
VLNFFNKNHEHVRNKVSEQRLYEKSRYIKLSDLSNDEFNFFSELYGKIGNEIIEIESKRLGK